MAADASLPLERISGAMHAMFNMLSRPDTLPELSPLQVGIRHSSCTRILDTVERVCFPSIIFSKTSNSLVDKDALHCPMLHGVCASPANPVKHLCNGTAK